jgi:hypothetical protein
MPLPIEPIVDRTQADVDFALRQIEVWKMLPKSNAAIVPTVDLKGCLNAADLNRIETNLQWLAATLSEYGFSVSITSKLDWDRTIIPTTADVARILGNVTAVCQSAGIGVAEIPSEMNHFDDINAIENITLEIATYLDNLTPDMGFVVLFSSLDGLTVTGVWNEALGRMEC